MPDTPDYDAMNVDSSHDPVRDLVEQMVREGEIRYPKVKARYPSCPNCASEWLSEYRTYFDEDASVEVVVYHCLDCDELFLFEYEKGAP